MLYNGDLFVINHMDTSYVFVDIDCACIVITMIVFARLQ